MILKSSLFSALALTIAALSWPLQLFDADVSACKDTASAVRIEACTRAINSTGWHYGNLSWAYANRGDAYRIKGETDLAVQTEDGVREAQNRRTVISLQP